MHCRIVRSKNLAWIVIAAIAASIAIRVFLVQELFAALLLFSVMFACVAGITLTVFGLDCAARVGFSRAVMYMRLFGTRVRRVRIVIGNPAVVSMLTPPIEQGTSSNK